MKSRTRQARARKPTQPDTVGDKKPDPESKDEENKGVPSLQVHNNYLGLPGLVYIPNFLTKEEHDSMLSILYGPQNNLWIHEEGRFGGQLQRRNQQFGWKYCYTTQNIEKADQPMPSWITPYIQRLQTMNLIDEVPDQMIVNEYTPGQGITPHIDKVYCFGKVVIGLNLGSGISIQFAPLKNRKNVVEVYVEPRSAYLMKGEIRYDYLHSIQNQTFDVVNLKRVSRSKRVSLTLRTTIHDQKSQEKVNSV